MSNNILFVFEGEKTEFRFVESLERHIFPIHSIGNTLIKCSFKAEIYQLYRSLKGDPYLDDFNLIKERDRDFNISLGKFIRKDFAEIYLFFDYDGHSTLPRIQDDDGNSVKSGDERLREMLAFFNNETENGKLYISYPMVEALKHVSCFDTFWDVKALCKGRNCLNLEFCSGKNKCIAKPSYKECVSKESISHLLNVNKYSYKIWIKLINVHLKKMNYIVNDKFCFPCRIESQETIFLMQIEKYINKSCPTVSVLSAFPIFIHDYFGNVKSKELFDLKIL